MNIPEAIENVEIFAASIVIRKKVPGFEFKDGEGNFTSTEEKLPAVMILAKAAREMPEIDWVMQMFCERKMDPLMYVNEMRRLLIKWNEIRFEEKNEKAYQKKD